MKRPPFDVWFEDYDAEVVIHGVLTHFDGDCSRDKATVVIDGVEHRIKLGRLSTRRFEYDSAKNFRSVHPRLVWILSGKRTEAYKVREISTEWSFAWGPRNRALATHPDMVSKFDTLHKAIHGAQVALQESGEKEIELFRRRMQGNRRHTTYDSQNHYVMVYDNGQVIRFSTARHNMQRVHGKQMNVGSFIDGYGKGSNALYRPNRVWYGGKRHCK